MRNRTMMKTLTKTMLATVLALAAATFAYADANPANDSGSFTVRITPNVDLGVIVDTTGANWAGPSSDLDLTSDLNTSTLLEAPVGIAMAGNFGNQELTLTGAALNTWTLDTVDSDNDDKLRLYALFGRSSFVSSPLVADFDGAVNLITTTPTRAGQPQADEGGDTNHVYELSTSHAENPSGQGDVDGMLSTATRKLWLRATTPSLSSTDQQQTFTVTVTAVTGAGL